MAPTPRFFYLDGALCRKILVNRAADTFAFFHYPDEKVKVLSYTYVKKNIKPAWRPVDVCRLLGRSHSSVVKLVQNDIISEPQSSFRRGPNGEKLLGTHFWSEDDVINAHEWYLTKHKGRPRNDGLITNARGLPTRRELRALMRDETILYVKTDEGFVPTWQAPEF